MSSGSEEARLDLLGKLARELRQFNGLGASFFRAAAGRLGMTVTDMEVIDILDVTGPTTAGQLAGLTGLTTGAITGMINRLEEASLVRRERDPGDGRRVIVRLASGKDDLPAAGPVFASLAQGWDEIASHYDDAQIALLLEFVKRCNAMSRQQIVQLREAPSGEAGVFSAPLGDLERGRLVVSSEGSLLTVRADDAMAELYQARFEGPVPEVKVKEGMVTIRYPRRLWVLGREKRAAEVKLSVAIPWEIVIQGGASQVEALLGSLDLAALEVKGAASAIRLELPVPARVVPIRIGGGASEITVRRPAGVAARVHLKGWASQLVFDDQSLSGVGNDVRLQSPGYQATAPCYDIEVASSASMVTITAG